MRKNKLSYFLQVKRIKYPNRQKTKPIINHDYSQWEQIYYRKKQILNEINNSNQNIKKLIANYEINPTIYNLQMLQKIIESNCKKINQCDQILNNHNNAFNMNYALSSSSSMQQLNENVSKHFQNLLFKQIKALFQAKNAVAQISNKADIMQKSFTSFTNPMNGSFVQHNLSHSRSNFGQNRQQIFKQVNYKIQNLNIILRRMNVLVSQQGESINRIDQNMQKGRQNMEKGKQKLSQRARRQQGEGQFQFSFQGRINKAIFALYGVNIILILILLLKNIV